jgi:hypothetical protein
VLQVYPQSVPPPLLSWALAHAQEIIRQREPDEVIGRRGKQSRDVDPYMGRWHLLRKNQLSGIENIYLHRFVRSDPEDLHDHPWANASILLSGTYTELGGRPVWGISEAVRNPGDVVIRGADVRHAIRSVEPGTISLFITGPKVREWGFWLDDGFVPWRDYRAAKDNQEKSA